MAGSVGSILLVFRKADVASRLAAVLQSGGFQVADICGSSGEALRAAGTRNFDIVLASDNLPDATGLNFSMDILERRDCSVILITSASEKAYVERTADQYDINCLVRPVSRNVLLQAVEMTCQYRRRMSGLRSDKDRLERVLERRALVAKAKGVLMRAQNLTEPEAFRVMQKTSMDTGIPIKEIARVILDTDGRQLYRYT